MPKGTPTSSTGKPVGNIFKDGSTPGTCKTCGAPAWHPRSNKCAEHRNTPAIKVKAEPKKTKAAPAPRVASDGGPVDDPSPLATAVAEAGKITAKTFSDRPPNAKEWEDKLTSLVVLLTMTYVEYAIVKPFKLPEQVADAWVERLGMTEEEAATIVEPCSFVIAKTDLNKKHGREAIEILAFAPAILSVISWADRVTEFRREMQQQLERGDNVLSFTSPSTSQGPSRAESGGPPVANFRGVTDPSQAPTARVDRDSPDVDEQN